MPNLSTHTTLKMRVSQLSNKIKTGYSKLPLHWVLALLVAVHGIILLKAALPEIYLLFKTPTTSWLHIDDLHELIDSVFIEVLFALMLGTGLVTNAIGLTLRARTAWFMSLFLLLCNVGYDFLYGSGLVSEQSLDSYLVGLILLLLVYGRRFNQASVISATLFAALGVVLLLTYSIFGALYFGQEYTPHITNLSQAFYFSIVTMSTVGFGDIVPTTAHSRLFTSSMIVLGITLFATSMSAVVGPLIQGRIQHLIKDKHANHMKKNHIIIAGASALTYSVYNALVKAGHDVVVIVSPNITHDYPADADLIVGDATDAGVLNAANAAHATYVLALRDDDAENAFIVLAAREAGSPQLRTVALVNTPMHLNKIKQVNPDVILSLQSLGAEILARLVTGEPISDALINQLLFPLEKHSTSTSDTGTTS